MRRVCRIGTSLVNRLVLAAVFALWTIPAGAHPHVWITAKIAFLTDGSRLIAKKFATTRFTPGLLDVSGAAIVAGFGLLLLSASLLP